MSTKTQTRIINILSTKKTSSLYRVGRKLRNDLRNWIKTERQKRILRRSIEEYSEDDLCNLGDIVFRYLEKRSEGRIGRYCYSGHGETPILYASIYAALIYDLLNKVDDLTQFEKKEWVDYINSFQCEDGLFRDPQVNNDIAEIIDWWGWRHLSAHVVSAITALKGKTQYPFYFLNFLYDTGHAYNWIKNLSWQENSTNVSNSVMNHGVMLQYERDYWHNQQAGTALDEIYTFLDESIDDSTGLWYWSQPENSNELSNAVQTSYHLWNLYFYDQRKIPYIEKAIDSCLATQNGLGGFGAQCNSSACEDIDSIDPLCRFYFLTDYRRSDIEQCLKRALKWVLVNQTGDGGFVFRRFEGFKYGHQLMETGPEESNLFATWFRMLSIAYVSQILEITPSKSKFNLTLHCPGYQFWSN